LGKESLELGTHDYSADFRKFRSLVPADRSDRLHSRVGICNEDQLSPRMAFVQSSRRDFRCSFLQDRRNTWGGAKLTVLGKSVVAHYRQAESAADLRAGRKFRHCRAWQVKAPLQVREKGPENVEEFQFCMAGRRLTL
jgi:hypothetical protein